MNALIIKKEHLDKILSGEKTWELRGSRTNKSGPIALIESGSGLIVGTAFIVGCLGPLYDFELQLNSRKHRAELSQNGPLNRYKKVYAWELSNAKRLDKPIPYRHPQGAIIWVKVDEIEIGG